MKVIISVPNMAVVIRNLKPIRKLIKMRDEHHKQQGLTMVVN